MNCADARPQMLDDARGSLSQLSRHALAEHVAACPDCANEAEEVRRGWAALEVLPAEPVPSHVRSTVLGLVGAGRARATRPTSRLAPLVAGLVAAVGTVTLMVSQDPDCRSPLSIACCGVLWVLAYAGAFAVVDRRPSGDAARTLVGRGLLAAAGGLLLVRMCPGESSELLPLPILSTLAERASTSLWSGFAYGALVAAIPLVLVSVVVRLARPTIRTAFRTAGIQFIALAPALYLASSSLALFGLVAVLSGTAVGALASALFEAVVRGSRPSPRAHA